MSEVPRHLLEAFAANDAPNDLRSVVGVYRRSGGSDGGGMGPRIAKLESDVEHLKRDIGELRTDMRDVRDRLTRIETRVDHLPSKGFVVTSLVLFLAVIAALVTFQGNIQRLVGQASLGVSPSETTIL